MSESCLSSRVALIVDLPKTNLWLERTQENKAARRDLFVPRRGDQKVRLWTPRDVRNTIRRRIRDLGMSTLMDNKINLFVSVGIVSATAERHQLQNDSP